MEEQVMNNEEVVKEIEVEDHYVPAPANDSFEEPAKSGSVFKGVAIAAGLVAAGVVVYKKLKKRKAKKAEPAQEEVFDEDVDGENIIDEQQLRDDDRDIDEEP